MAVAIVRAEGFSFWYPLGKAGAGERGGRVSAPAAEGARAGASSSARTCVPDNALRVLDRVSFSLDEGEFCTVAGPSGCGKTTLLRSLKPELAPTGAYAGTVEALGVALVRDGQRASELDARASAEGIGFVMQDPAAQIVCDTVWHELAFCLENLGMPQEAMRRRVAEVAHFFGIEPWMRARTETLSGGQMQLVNLAAVLAVRPRLLLLDEPCAQLDPHARQQFLLMLARVNRELGVTVMMATHAPEDVEELATRRLDLGDVGRIGAREDALAALRASGRAAAAPPTPAGGSAAAGRPAPTGSAPIATEGSTLTASAPAAVGVPAPTGSTPAAAASPRFAAFGALRARSQGAPSPAIEAREVFFRYERSAPWVLRGLDVSVERGRVHAFVGGNGCGKTTLLKVLAGAASPQRGRVRNNLAASQALLPQDPKALLVCDTVDEELAEWQERCGYSRADVQATMERFGLADLGGRCPYDLSGGQQQKLAFAKQLLTGAQLLFLDEPTKGLDPASCAECARTVRELAEEGRTVVMVTHDLNFAAVCADTVSLVFDGELACTEPAAKFFASNLVYRPDDASRLYGALL